jgi:hypothetical protein
LFVFFPVRYLASRFHAAKVDIVFSRALTLGALFFDVPPDCFGRKGPLVDCVAF